MNKVGIFDLKTHVSDFIRRVQEGEEFLITNRGEAVAVLTSPEKQSKKKTKNLVSQIWNVVEHSNPGSYDELMQWKNEGRK